MDLVGLSLIQAIHRQMGINQFIEHFNIKVPRRYKVHLIKADLPLMMVVGIYMK
jgi:hypothetical protein